MELVKLRKVEEETNNAIWMPSTKRLKMNAWQDYIGHEIDLSKEFTANFFFLKIHLMSQWGKQSRRYGALRPYSAKTQEQAHNTNLKDGWNASNHNLNYLPQDITIECRIL
jgi:hypothetical protein